MRRIGGAAETVGVDPNDIESLAAQLVVTKLPQYVFHEPVRRHCIISVTSVSCNSILNIELISLYNTRSHS